MKIAEQRTSDIGYQAHAPLKVPSKQRASIPIAQELFKGVLPSTASLAPRNIMELSTFSAHQVKAKNSAHKIFTEFGISTALVRSGTQLLAFLRWSMLYEPYAQDELVNRLSGSPHLSKTLKILSAALAPLLQSVLVSPAWHAVFNNFLSTEQPTYKKILDVLLPNIYINLARTIQQECHEEGENRKIGLPELVGYLSKIVQEHLPDIREGIDKIDHSPASRDLAKRKKKLKKLFRPLSDDILAAAFPKGLKELPLRHVPLLSQKIWNKIQEELPLGFYWIYEQLTLPFNDDKKKLLLSMPGGDSLVLLAEVIAQSGGEKIPSYFLKGTAGEPSAAIVPLLKGFRSIIQGSESLKTWLCNWLMEQCDQLGTTKDAHITRIWAMLGSYIEPLCIHIFYHLSEVPPAPEKLKGKTPDVLSICLIKLFSLFSQFFNAHEKIIAERVEALKAEMINPEKDDALLELFKKLSSEFLRLLRLEEPSIIPIPAFLKDVVVDGLKEVLPRFFLKQYILITSLHGSNDDISGQMRKQFFDKAYLNDPVLAMNVISTLYAQGDVAVPRFLDFFYEELWNKSGTDKIVRTIEGMGAALSYQAVEGWMRAFGISNQRILRQIVNPFMQRVNAYSTAFVERMFLNFLNNLMASTEEKMEAQEGEHPQNQLLFNIFYRLIDQAQAGLKGIEERLQIISESYPKGSYAASQEIRQLFLPLASSLHYLFGKEGIQHLPLDGLPEPENVKQVLWDTLKETIFADKLFVFYSESAEWQQAYAASVKQLEHYFQTTHPLWACRVLAQYARDFAQNYLASSSRDAARLLYESVLVYFDSVSNASGRATKALIAEQEAAIVDLFTHNLRALGESEEPVILEFWSSFAFYAEAALVKFLAQLSKSIQGIEQSSPDLVVDTAIALLRQTTEHFKRLNQVSEALDADQAYLGDQRAVLAGFGSSLNDGVPIDPSALPEDKERIRIQGFFYPLTCKLFHLAGIARKDLPLPALFRDELGDLLLQKLIPLGLLKSTEQALQNSVRDELMLSFVQMLYAALTKIELDKKMELPEEKSSQVDPKQKHLNETCGALVLELVKLIPDTMVQYVFMKEQVKNMSAETIGESIMPYLTKWTFLQIIDSFIYSVLPNFHPGRWEGKVGREVLAPRKAFVRPDGKDELKPVKAFKFAFPKTVEQALAEARWKQQEAKLTRTLLRNGFTRTISSQLQQKAWSILKELWDTGQRALDDFIERQFQQKGVQFKAALDLFFRKLFIECIGSVLLFMLTPVCKLVGLVIEKTYIDARSEDIIENLHSDTLENLFYNSIDTVLETLLKLHTPQGVAEPIPGALK
jgi:hypothetical protein